MLFDDVCEDEYGAWALVCENHAVHPRIQELGSIKREYNGSMEVPCSVLGCRNCASHYIDFNNWDSPMLIRAKDL